MNFSIEGTRGLMEHNVQTNIIAYIISAFQSCHT